MFTYEQYQESAAFLQKRLGEFQPELLLILGSGLGFLAGEVEGAVVIPYGEIPHFARSTAPDHAGRLVCGTLAGRRVMVMDGRFHIYEGYSAYQAAYPVRVAKLLGVQTMVVTNACGAINKSYQVGDVMLISDHIRLFDPNPLVGPNLPEFGPRFCDMTYAYDPACRKIAKEEADKLGMTLQEGVYFYFPGPQFETPAEIRAARVLGGDAAGMSTVPEVICANHCGIRVLGFSLVTNMAAGVLDQRLDGVDVLQAAERARDGFSALVRACLPRL